MISANSRQFNVGPFNASVDDAAKGTVLAGANNTIGSVLCGEQRITRSLQIRWVAKYGQRYPTIFDLIFVGIFQNQRAISIEAVADQLSCRASVDVFDTHARRGKLQPLTALKSTASSSTLRLTTARVKIVNHVAVGVGRDDFTGRVDLQ